MQAIITDFLTQVAAALVSLLAAVIIFCINKIRAKIEAETESIKSERKKQLVKEGIELINTLAYKAVLSTEQTVISELRKAAENGKIDHETLVSIGDEVKEYIYNQIPQDIKALLEEYIVDVKKYISDTVESYVLQLKNSQ